MADERLLGVRQQKHRVPLRFGQRQSCRHGRPRVRLECRHLIIGHDRLPSIVYVTGCMINLSTFNVAAAVVTQSTV